MQQKTNNWQIKKLGEVCKLKNGFAFKSDNYLDNGIPVIRISDIKDGLIVPRNTVYISEDSVYDNYIINENEIIVAMSGATTGKFGIYKSKEKAYQNQRVGKFDIIDKKQLDNNFLLHQLHSLKRQIEKDAYGGAQPNISSKKIEEMEIVLPPLETQHAIVSKIEELFSELDKGIAELKTAQQQLKTYRQSVLKSAFEGKLTNENVKDGELPDGWEWKTFSDVCVRIGDIDHKMPKKTENGKYPYLSTKDITNDFKLSFDNVKLISEEDYLMLSRKIKPEKGDIIFPRYGTIGKNVLVDTDKKFLISYSCAIIKPNTNLINEKYIYLFSLSPKVTDEIRKYVVETTQANIGIGSIKSFVFPLAPLEDQHRVVQEIESRLSVADKMEQSIQESLQKAEALRQSILKKAFCGELV